MARYMDYPSPRGVHVPENYYFNDPDDPYRRPPSRRNRYSRSLLQTPRTRDLTWVSSPDPVTPQTPHAPPSPWLPPPSSSAAYHPPSAIPPSPAPTVGEHMTVDDFTFVPDSAMDPYHRLQRPSLIRSLWKGLKKLSGFQPSLPFPIPRPSPYQNQIVEMPVPGPSSPSEMTQYVNPTPPGTAGTEEQRGATPYTSPYAQPADIRATPAIIPGSLRASPAPVPSIDIPPPITIVSPSIPPSPLPASIRSIRRTSPMPAKQSLSVGVPEPAGSAEEGSQTFHEPTAPQPVVSMLIPVMRSDSLKLPSPSTGRDIQAFPVEHLSSKGSLSSTMARFRRFVAGVDELPWISDNQIADEYIPEKNPRSRLRARVRQGAEPSWYNARPEVVQKPEYWSEWDMWAKQSTAVLWDGTTGGNRPVRWAGVSAGGEPGQGQGQWEPVYPHGYAPVPAQPEFVYPSGYPPPGVVSEQGHAPVLP